MAGVLHSCICRVGCREFGGGEGGFKGKNTEDMYNTNGWSTPKDQALVAWELRTQLEYHWSGEIKPWERKQIVLH